MEIQSSSDSRSASATLFDLDGRTEGALHFASVLPSVVASPHAFQLAIEKKSQREIGEPAVTLTLRLILLLTCFESESQINWECSTDEATRSPSCPEK
jgi:hypothetical protein